jgi:hypothetical protein
VSEIPGEGFAELLTPGALAGMSILPGPADALPFALALAFEAMLLVVCQLSEWMVGW